jgi:DMSO/TMAO reductase YedYZ molybdopterin-dependent catalytic subunit
MSSWFEPATRAPEASALRIGIVALLLVALFGTLASAQTPSVAKPTARLEVRGDSIAPRVFTAADLAELPRVQVRATAHGTTASFSGVTVASVLRLAGVPIDSVRGGRAATYVVASAADGYRVVFSLAELAPDLTRRVVLLADERDGKALAGDEGPLRLVLPDDARPTRWVRQLTSLTVRQAAP